MADVHAASFISSLLSGLDNPEDTQNESHTFFT